MKVPGPKGPLSSQLLSPFGFGLILVQSRWPWGHELVVSWLKRLTFCGRLETPYVPHHPDRLADEGLCCLSLAVFGSDPLALGGQLPLHSVCGGL